MNTVKTLASAVLALCAAQALASKRIDVAFTGYTGGDALSNFPALVRLSTAIEGFSYADFSQDDGGDLRFYDASGNMLAHEIDTWDTNGVSTVWVKVPSLTASTTVTAKYGYSAPPAARNASEVWSSGYVGVWHLGESASPLAASTPGASEFKTFDSGNPGRDTINGIKWAQEGVVGRTTKFGPDDVYTNSCLRALHRDEYEGMDALTVEAWACRDTNTVYNGYVLDMALHSGTNYAWRMYDVKSGSMSRVKCEVCTLCETGTVRTTMTSGTVSANVWIHQAFTYDSRSANAKNAILYLDGASKVSAAGGDSPVKVTKSGILYLGNQQGYYKYTTPFPGRIDEVRISSVARPPAWVKATHDTVANADFAAYSEVMDGIPKVLDVFGTATNVYAEIDKKGASALAIRGNTLFCGAGDLLYVLDVSNPLAPRYVSKLAGFSQLRQIAVEGDLLGISSRGGGAWLVDVSDISAPRILSHIDTVEQATGMEIAGNFMAIGQRSTGVELIDITDRTRPQHICLVKTQESQSCRYQNGILYSGDWHSGQVNLIDVTDISKASIIGTTLMHGYGDGFDIDGDYIYASTGHHRIRGEVSGNDKPENYGQGHGLEIWNRSNPSNVVFVSRVEFPQFYRQGNDWWQCCESGGWVFCSDTHNGVFAVDARDPENAYVSDRFVDFNPKDPDAPSRCINSIAVGNGAVYATSGGGLWVIPCEYAHYRAEDRGTELTQENLSWRDPYTTPPNSHFTAWIPPARGPVHSAAAFGGCYYAGCSYAGAYVIDARTLRTLRKIPCAYARDVYVRDGKLYIAQGDEGLGIYSLDDPANPVEERRITKLTDKLSHFEWVYVPTSRWAVCHARRNSGNWYFIDLSKDPAETVSYVMSTNLTKKIAGVSGMDWVRPFADELIGGKWLGYARTHGFFMWFDMSGDRPVCYDTTDTTSTIVNSASRPNYIKTSSCCTPISDDKVLVANSGNFFILDPEIDRDPRVETWPTFVYSNCSKPVPNGMSSWDGQKHVGLAAQQARTIQMADFSVMDKPVLEWHESTIGCPENGVFDAEGTFLVPCGYQGLLVQKRPEVPAPAPDSFAHSFDVTFTGYAGGETLTDFPVLVRLSDAIDGFSYSGFLLPNGGDLRFFDANGNLLSHEIDTWNENGESTVWVKVPRLDATAAIKAAYGCAAPPVNDPSAVWSNGYAGVWHLNETASPFVNAMQTGENFTCSNPSLVGIGQGGVVGKAVKFDILATGSSAHKGYLSLDDSANKFAGKQQMAIEMWVCHHATNTNRRLLYRKNGSTALDFLYQYPDYAGNSKLTFTFGTTNMHAGAAQVNAAPYCRYDALKGGWMHIGLVFDSVDAKKLLSYANGMNNGSSDDSKSLNEGWCTVPNGGSVLLGNMTGTSASAFPGSVDEVRISAVARSADWMKATHDTVMKPGFASYSAVDVVNDGYAAWTGANGIPGEPEQRHNGIAKGVRYAFDIAPAYGPHEIGTPILDIGPGSDGAVSVKLRPLAENRSDVAYGVLATESLDDWEHATFVPYGEFTEGMLSPSEVKDPVPAQMFFKYRLDIQQ